MNVVKNNKILLLCGCVILVSCITLFSIVSKKEKPSYCIEEEFDKICIEVNRIEENTMKLNPVDAFDDIELRNMTIEDGYMNADVIFHINHQYFEWNAIGIFENRYAFEILLEEEEMSEEVYTLHIQDETTLSVHIEEEMHEELYTALQEEALSELTLHLVFKDIKEGYQRDYSISQEEITWNTP